MSPKNAITPDEKAKVWIVAQGYFNNLKDLLHMTELCSTQN